MGEREEAGRSKTRMLLATHRPGHYRAVCDALSHDFEITVIETGWEAVQALKTREFEIIVVESDLMVLNGQEFLKQVRADGLSTASRLFVHGEDSSSGELNALKEEGIIDAALRFPFKPGNFLGAVWALSDQVAENNWDRGLSPLQSKLLRVTSKNIRDIFRHAEQEGAVDLDVVGQTSRLIVQGAKSFELGDVLARLRDHHSYSFVHSLKVASLMTIFGVYLGMKNDDLEVMAQGGLLHDIGKSKTPAELLDKPSKLDADEWAMMQNHVPLSRDILRSTPGISETIINIAERHHEKMDGSGYPHGLTGTQLDDPSLVASIMDIYSALTDKRAYKQPFTAQKSLSIMQDMCGHHIEESFFHKFREMIRSGAGYTD